MLRIAWDVNQIIMRRVLVLSDIYFITIIYIYPYISGPVK